MLLCSPNYLNQTSLPLCVPGEPESELLAFAKETMLWASPANAGAERLANELEVNPQAEWCVDTRLSSSEEPKPPQP